MLNQDRKNTERRLSRRSDDNFVFDEELGRKLGKRTGKVLAKKSGCQNNDGFPRISDLHSMSESFKPIEEPSDVQRKSIELSGAILDKATESFVFVAPKEGVRKSNFSNISSIRKRDSRSPVRESLSEIIDMLKQGNQGAPENNNKRTSRDELDKTEPFIFQERQTGNEVRESGRVSWDKMEFSMNQETKKEMANKRKSFRQEEKSRNQAVDHASSAVAIQANPQKKKVITLPVVANQEKKTAAIHPPTSSMSFNPPPIVSSSVPSTANQSPPISEEVSKAANIRSRTIKPQMIHPMYPITEKDEAQSHPSSSFLSKKQQSSNIFANKSPGETFELASQAGASSKQTNKLVDGQSNQMPGRNSLAIYQEIQQLVDKERADSKDYDPGKRPRNPSVEEDKPRKQRMSDKEQKEKQQRKEKDEEKKKKDKKNKKDKKKTKEQPKKYEKESAVETRRQKDAVILPSELRNHEGKDNDRREPLSEVPEESEEREESNCKKLGTTDATEDQKRTNYLKERNRKSPQAGNRTKTGKSSSRDTHDDPKQKKPARNKAKFNKKKKERTEKEQRQKEARQPAPILVPLEDLIKNDSCRSVRSQRTCIPPIKYWEGQRVEINKGEIVGVFFTHPLPKKVLQQRFNSTSKHNNSQSQLEVPETQLQRRTKSIEQTIGITSGHELIAQLKPNVYHLELPPNDEMALNAGYFKSLMIRILQAKKNKVSIQFEDSNHKIKDYLEIVSYQAFKLSNRSGTHKALIELEIIT